MIFEQTNQNNAFTWQVDEYNNIYKEYTDNSGEKYRKYLACFGTGDERILSLSSSASGHEASWNLRIADDNRVYYESDSHNFYYLNYKKIQEGTPDHIRGYVTKNYNGNNGATASTSGSHQVTIPAFNPGTYKLEIFGTNKTTPVKTVTVNSASDAGIYEIDGLNNDAVMFRISELDSGKQAVVNVTLKLEALNPYINSMNIVCHDPNEQLNLTQTFNASDFKVSGGRFVFHIPDEYADSLLTISFADLYSNYGDTTYYNGERNGNARYSFVTSEYFVKNENLYAPNGDVDDHTRKVIASTAGNIRFRFNNADILEHLSGTTSNNNTLQEYAFDLHTYVNGYEDPDGNTNSDGTIITGDTIPCLMKASEEAIRSRTFYVFTADETRFNIAPTTAWQHRGYAFYRMDIELQAVEYTPKLTWTKIYDEGKTFYEDANGQIQTKSMWGVKLNTEDSAGEFTGYLTVKEIIKAIDDEMDNTEITTPADKDQILYIDASDLYSIVNSVVIDPNTNVADTLNLSDLKQGLAPNAIIFLPSKATTKLDNFAYLSDGVFRAGNHIIITDKNPFYSPYDIQVDASNYAKRRGEVCNCLHAVHHQVR